MKHNIRQLLNSENILVSPGVYDCYSALLAQQAGFKLVSSTGAGLVNSRLGQPDVGLFSVTDNLNAVRQIASSVDIPLSADAETGYGNAVTVWYVVKQFESAGAASVSIEDQVSPKRCGHVSGKEVISRNEMAGKIAAAVDARVDPNFLIIARTDAIATGGIGDAIDRAKAYADAGADVIFPDAVTGQADIEALVRAVDIPVRINMGFGLRTRSTTPLMSVAELANLGVRWVSLSRMLPAAAIKGMSDALSAMRESIETGVTPNRPDLVADMSDIQKLMDYETYFDLENKFLAQNDYSSRNQKV